MTIWTDEVKARLGNEPDANIAADIGVSRVRVGQVRTRLGIPKFERPRRIRVTLYVSEEASNRFTRAQMVSILEDLA